MLGPSLSPLRRVWAFLPVALMVCFLPVTMALIEGQDSLLLLALLIAAYLALQKQHDFRAGMLLGATLFKFQYALPIVLLYLIWRRWRFLAGFALAGAIVVGLSVAVIGPSGVFSF